MTSFLSAADVAQIAGIRRDGWETAYAVADPRPVLVLDRDGVVLDDQPVLIDWTARQTRAVGGTAGAMETVDADVVFRRPEPFDVRKGDRFRLADGDIDTGTGPTGVVTRAYRDKGLVFAEAVLDVIGG